VSLVCIILVVLLVVVVIEVTSRRYGEITGGGAEVGQKGVPEKVDARQFTIHVAAVAYKKPLGFI